MQMLCIYYFGPNIRLCPSQLVVTMAEIVHISSLSLIFVVTMSIFIVIILRKLSQRQIIIIIIITRYASTHSFFSVFFVPIKLTHIVHNYLHPISLLHAFWHKKKIIIIIIIKNQKKQKTGLATSTSCLLFFLLLLLLLFFWITTCPMIK